MTMAVRGNTAGNSSVIIIGAGLAGLSAGCYCQMNGYRTHIFEHHTQPGGVAATWKRKGYTIDGGIHFIMGHQPGQASHEVYRELGILAENRFQELTVYGRYIDEKSGRQVTLSRDIDRLRAELKALSPQDGREIDALMAGARAMGHLDMGTGLDKPPELAGRLGGLKELWSMRRVLKYLGGEYAQPMQDYVQRIRDPFLRRILKHLLLPEVPVWFIFMLLGGQGGLGLVEAGSQGVVSAVEKRYLELGGQVTYQATVEKILVERNRAVGVRLADGREFRAGRVVSAADGYSTLYEMLEGRYVDSQSARSFQEWPLFRPLVMVNFGVARDFPGEPPFQTLQLAESIMINHKPVDQLLLRLLNYSSHFAPRGKRVVQAYFESEWDYWKTLREEDREGYGREKERVGAEILTRLERLFPGMASQVEMTDVATPYTTWRYTRNWQGAYEGWLMTPQSLKTRFKRTLPGLENFYRAGQWVMPGGGVLPVLYSGRHVAQLLCLQDGKEFVTRQKDQ